MNDEIVLRDVLGTDLPVFFEHQSDPVANRMAVFPAREHGRFTSHWNNILSDDSIIKKTILLDGQIVGNIVSFEQAGQRLVGYWIGREFWGKGVATRALSAFLSHDRTRPLYARVVKHNVASLRVLQKCGFAIVGEDQFLSDASGETIEELALQLGPDAATTAGPNRR